jgi:hypothetical protein
MFFHGKNSRSWQKGIRLIEMADANKNCLFLFFIRNAKKIVPERSNWLNTNSGFSVIETALNDSISRTKNRNSGSWYFSGTLIYGS